MKLRFGIKNIVGAMLLFLLWAHISDYIQFAKHPELYPIGEGEFGWICKSFENYALGCRMAIGWDILGVVISVCHRFKYNGKNPAGTFCAVANHILTLLALSDFLLHLVFAFQFLTNG